MVREIDLEQVALNLEAAVKDVRDRHNQLVVVYNGERVMTMIPVEFYDRWFAEREKAFQYFDEARAPVLICKKSGSPSTPFRRDCSAICQIGANGYNF